MVKRPRVECAAMIDRPGDPYEIADKLSRLEHDRQTAAATSAVERWRKIVADVAAGKEPDGPTIDSIGELVRTLRLAPDSLASHVAAWRECQRLDAIRDEAAAEIKNTKARNEEIMREVRELEKRLGELRLAVQKYHATAAGYPHVAGSCSEQRNRYPLLYADPAVVARSLVEVSPGMSRERIAPPVAVSSASWE